MRVLHVSHNHHIVGGSDRVFFETSALLEKAGHEIFPFCLSGANDLPSAWSEFFPRGADTSHPRLSDTARYFYNSDARRRLSRLLDAIGPIDVAHLHIYHGKLTPAILPVLKARGIPILHTLHEYKLACPVYTMQRHGTNCDRCVGGSVLSSIRHRCKDGSILKSAVMAAEMTVSRMLGDVRLIDRFICVSTFQRDIMLRAGLPASKLVTLHNFTKAKPRDTMPGHDGYLLYAGRIEALKGLPTLVNAIIGTGRRLIIAGGGSWVPELRERISNHPDITYLGFKAGRDLQDLIQRSQAVIVPSEWYENCPMTVLEAKASGRPVVASRIGGIPELVRDGIDGFLFDPGDVAGLRQALERLDAADYTKVSENAQTDVRQRFSARMHLAGLLRVYAAAGAGGEFNRHRLLAASSDVDPQPFAQN